MSIEKNIERLAEAQERTATALEALLAHLGSTAAPFTASGATITPGTSMSAAEEAQIETDLKTADDAAAKAAAKKKADDAAKAAAKKKADDEAAAAAAAEAAKAAEVDPLADAPVDEAKTYTVDEVRKVLMDYRAIEGAPAMMEILKNVGKVDSLAALKPENYAAVVAAASK